MSSSASSDSRQTITNVVFGLTATIISTVTVWQGHRAWKMWREHAHEHENVAPDLELGIQSPQSTITNVDAPEHEEDVVDGTIPTVNQIGEGAEPHHTSASAEGLDLHTPSPTAVVADTSLNLALVQGARVEVNQVPKVHTDNTQPVLADMEHLDLRPTACDHL